MGIRFKLEHANFLGYLLSPAGTSAPRANRAELSEFLKALSYSGNSADYGVTAFDGMGLRTALPRPDTTTLSADLGWLNDLQATARDCFERLEERSYRTESLTRHDVEEFLSPLRPFFTGYALSALVLPHGDVYQTQSRDAARFFEQAAVTSGRYGIFVMPDRVDGAFTILDPFPQLAALAEIPIDPPLVAFWSPDGAACVLALDDAREFYQDRLRPILAEGAGAVGEVIAQRDSEIKRHRIVHLSDFHFGETRSNLKRRYVQGHLRKIVRRDDLVVLTGDQIDTPRREYSDEYVEFRDEIQNLTGKEIVAIPGNHDVRRAGNRIPFLRPSTYELVPDIRFERTVIDREMGCILLNFNSLEEGVFARGSVSNDQLLRMAVSLEEKTNQEISRGNAAVTDYLKVALVHHHPYTYVTRAGTWYDWALRKVFRSEDKFIKFDNADRFTNWCAEHGVSLILHGHKHVPHHIRATIALPRGDHEMMVVSCGSTMGAEGSPLCYDVVYLHEDTRRWGVVFYQAASASGSPFTRQAMEVDYREFGTPRQ